MNIAVPSVAVSLTNRVNARLLVRLLGDEVNLHQDALGTDAPAVDLVIVDAASLRHNRELILHLREQADPMILPVLLVIDNRSNSSPHTAQELGRSVDDILRIPTSQAELKARIDNLLRLRSLSMEQDDAKHQLLGVVNALRTLNACDQEVVRAKTEKGLLEAICQTIVTEAGYSLVWVGFVSDDGEGMDVHASAGPAAKFLKDRQLNWVKGTDEACMVGRAIGQDATQVIIDVADDPMLASVLGHASQHGLAGAIALPLKTEGNPLGCLTICSNTSDEFSTEVQQLLERLASNLVFGLNALRVQKERALQAAEIHYLAYTDALTGLPNRRHLIHYLDTALADPNLTHSFGAILFIDLDGFKLINDALGHDVGDQVLMQIGQRLQSCVRESDFVVRQGGDEFLVVMANEPRRGGTEHPDDLIEGSLDLAQRIIAHLSTPLTAGGHKHHLKASVGISLCPDHGHDAAKLIENADKAMYHAKNMGGGRAYVFSEELATRRQQRFSLESRLRFAQEAQEFELYYQPIFELESCRIVAVEALIRWPQEDGSVLMPGTFLSLVEETGLIKPLGDWILITAARQLRAWHDLGYTVYMAVNFSINQLDSEHNAEYFASLVRPHIDPAWIHLEVTENALKDDASENEMTLTQLREQGFQLAIDDFGTGYSSLSRLQHLPIQTLKIDRSFVSELDDQDTKGGVLVPVIQQMASNLNLQTIAEGIETDSQRQRLLEISKGKGWGQGYWFSRPVNADTAQSLLLQSFTKFSI